MIFFCCCIPNFLTVFFYNVSLNSFSFPKFDSKDYILGIKDRKHNFKEDFCF